MLIDGGKIKEVKIKLFLSSRSEMQKVIETARAQSLTMQTFMQMPPAQITTNPIPATQIPPTPTQTTPVLPTQMPVKTTVPDIKPPIPPLPIENPPSEQTKAEFEAEKKDQDTESVSSKDAKRSRRGRSVSKSRDRSKSRERSRSRSRDRNYRNKDRYRDRRRRDRSRSRDRHDRRRHRDRSRSRDRSSRKSSRDRKRDSDRNDRNSSESNSNNAKSSTTIPDKEVNVPTTPLPTSKPGFTNSGWVAAGANEKPSNPSFTNPIGFSIGKQTDNLSASNEPQPRKNEEPTTKQIPLPQPSSISHSMLLPQPPPFPQLPLEVPKDEAGIIRPMTYPPIQPSNAMPTQHTNSLFMPNQPQMLQNESNKLIHQPGPLMMPPGWNPSMMPPPMVNNPHMLLGPMPPPMVGMNSADKMHMPMMKAPTVMYNRPPTLLSNDKIQPPHLQNDPRMQPGFNMQQPRNNDERDNIHAKHINNFGLQKQSSFAEGGLQSTSLRSSFLNSSVEIRNMAMNTTIMDIRRFFQGLEIPEDGIKIITDKKGNKVGMAYVRFSKPLFKEMAVRKSGKMLKSSVVEILHIEDNIFDKATDFSDYQGRFFKDNQNYKDNYNNFTELKEPSEIFTDLIIHEVPPFSKDREIYNLFKGFNIEDAFVLLRTGRKTATGYVRFRTPAEARRALVTSSRLTIGYNNVKAAICYEHEFNDARDRKNMEEEEEEDIMDTKDTGYPYENRNPRNLMKYTPYDREREQDGPETRYNQNDKRSHGHKTLLPTPNTKPFDSRSVYSNQGPFNNFNSRFDRRQQDHASRIPREDFNKKPNIREDFHQKPFPRESSRFQGRTASRDDFSENHRSMGDANRKPQTHKVTDNNFQEQSKKIEISHNVPKTNLEKSSTDSKVFLDNPIIPEDVKKEPLIGKNISNESIKSIPETTQSVIPPPELQEEVIVQKENDLKESKENLHSSQNMEIEKPMHFETDCIILRGLPFNANDRDILDFFSDEGLAPTQIHIMLNKLGQPAGDAFCEFNTVEEVHRALTKNRTLMGRSVVAVEPVPREEMMGALEIVVPLRHHVVNPVEECPESFQNTDYRRQDHRFPPRGRGFQNFPPRGRGRGGFRGRHHASLNLEQEAQNVNSFGKPGCVVALENVPFRAEVQDITDFFSRYFVSRDNVIRRFDENGKPTGDARVCLNSPEDANHAVRTLNQRHLFNRQIHLSLV